MPVEFSDQTIVATSANQVFCTLGEEVVLLGLDSGTYFGLNSVGSSIWEFLGTPHTVAEIRAWLLENYQVEADECQRDLQALLGDLSNAGLITLDPPAALNG